MRNSSSTPESSLYNRFARPVPQRSPVSSDQNETLEPETLEPETLNPETLEPETLAPESLQ